MTPVEKELGSDSVAGTDPARTPWCGVTAKARLALCPIRMVATSGADHTGVDVILRCEECGRETETYVEAHRKSPEVRKILEREWLAQNPKRTRP